MKNKHNKYVLLLFLTLFFSNCNKDQNPIELDPCSSNGITNGYINAPPYNSPIWHPNGNFIGFNHKPLKSINYPLGEDCYGVFSYSDSAGFWLINTDGTTLRRILPYTLLSPAWSPDGEWIAFVAPIADGMQIFKMKFTGNGFDISSLVKLTDEGRNFFPTWSPDGQWIAYDSNNDSPSGGNFIWKMKSNGTQKVRISYEPTQGEIRMPSWSPHGKKIVHIRYVIGTLSSEIFLMDSAGNNPVRLTNNNKFDGYPAFAPKNDCISFYSDRNLFIIDTLGNNIRQITTEGVDRDFGLPFSWSPDGSKIVYTYYKYNDWTTANGVLWIIDLNTGIKNQLTIN